MSKTINLGRVTAYADAVAAGYTGTREQFANDLANAANYAAEAGDAAETATEAATTASTAAETATGAAEEASADAEQAHADAQAILGAKETAVAAANTASSKAGEAANSAQQAAASETAAAGSATAASNAATSATASKNAAATSETNAANSANAAAQTLTNVNQAGATQVAAIQAKGTEVLNSIPADYTELSDDVDALKSDLNNADGAIDDLGIYVQSENIYSGVYTPNKQLDSNGNLIDVTDYGTTDFIPVVGDKTIYFGYENSSQYHSTQAAIAARYAIYDKYHVLIEANTNAWVNNVAIPSNGCYIRITASNTRLSGNYTINYDALQSIYTEYSAPYWKPKNEEQVEQNTADIASNKADADNKIALINNDTAYRTSYDVADGDMFSSAVSNDASNGYVAYHVSNVAQRRTYPMKRVVAVNHDDLQASDYLGTRKIYNKYGFGANFNFILLPFTDLAQKEAMVTNIKRLIADGNDLGLHAIMGASFWWMNKMWDMKVNFSTTFAPTLEELKTPVDGNKNVFGYTINSTSTFEDIGFANVPSNVTAKVVDATFTDWIYLIANYTIYTMYIDRVTGLDLTDAVQSWTGLHWLEYWYNELIDNTLGYSLNSQSLEANYLNDYKVPDGTSETGTAYMAYYPDAEHLLSGKVVRFDDTTNAHYSDNTYQKVGYFKQGLFKGCVSACNYEVIDRCIDIAKAFCKHYFGVDKFTNFGRHGVRYADCMWKDSGFVPYDNRDLTVLGGEVGKFYQSRSERFVNEHDILLEKDIRMTNHSHPLLPIFEGQVGLYFGQSGIRYPYFNHVYKDSGDIDYLALIGTSPAGSSETMDYTTFMSYMQGRDWLKTAYEQAGSYITKPDGTGSMYVFDKVKNAIDHIRACFETGKIPVFSWDTIKPNAATMAAIELVCQYCYDNNIEIVPVEKARELATSNGREAKQNYFPNPKFDSSILYMLGGTSTAKDAYRPDGWFASYQVGSINYQVSNEEIDGAMTKALTISTDTDTATVYLQSRVYGLPSGKYTFTIWAKRPNSNVRINVYAKKNSDYIERYYGDGNIKFSSIGSIAPTAEWTKYDVTFEIPDTYRALPNDTIAGLYSKGYENNVSNITFEIFVGSLTGGNEISIANPVLTAVT